MKTEVIKKMASFSPYLNEEQVRLYVASEAKAPGRGGKRLIEKELGISHNTINKGISDLESRSAGMGIISRRRRKEGGGRKRSITSEIWKHIEAFIAPHTRGEPESPLQWVSKSLRHIESALKERGIFVSHRIIGNVMF